MVSRRRIFIGDIHGDIGELKRVLGKLELKSWRDELVFLGDYIDKGYDSYGVLEELNRLVNSDIRTTLLWGNHDLMLYEWSTYQNLTYGETYEGQQTIDQLAPNKAGHDRNIHVYNKYKWLWERLESHAEYEEHVAVHGGLDFRKDDPINETGLHQKVNIRGYTYNNHLSKPVIVAHTPQPEILVSEDKKWVNIDTGSGIGGKLTPLIYYKDYGVYTDGNGKEVEIG